jgi:hypothetical protein
MVSGSSSKLLSAGPLYSGETQSYEAKTHRGEFGWFTDRMESCRFITFYFYILSLEYLQALSSSI